MRPIVCVLALCAGTATALAQAPMPPAPQPPPGTGETPPGDGDAPVDNGGSATPVPQPPHTHHHHHEDPPVPRAEPPAMQAPAGDPHRPSEFSIGIGVGYQLPTSLDTPNLTSVRFRLPSGLTFEPQLILASASRTVDTGMPITDEVTELGIGAVVRYPVVKRRRVDLEVLGALNIDQLETTPSSPDTGVRITTTKVSYGLAVSMWLARHWQISFTANNALVNSVKNRQEMGVGTVTVTTNTTYGLVFDPQVQMMIHLWY
ncbi:MAG: hypothetical protein KF773_09970 [Deltaproteobacteria bacterium]|nr:hypothetical protein [Deltaproteobacteria bacterium]MCW5807086.1 hypothetical protein [Deltaproteobacteria bacterium]